MYYTLSNENFPLVCLLDSSEGFVWVPYGNKDKYIIKSIFILDVTVGTTAQYGIVPKNFCLASNFKALKMKWYKSVVESKFIFAYIHPVFMKTELVLCFILFILSDLATV